MKAESSIRKQLQAVTKGIALLPSDDLAAHQAYGAAEALRWVLGEGVAPVGLTEPLGHGKE